MKIDFTDVVRDPAGNINMPTMVLQTLHERVIGVVGSYYDMAVDLKFNDVSELSFSVPAYDNGEKTPFYDDLEAMRMVDIYPYGKYVLREPKTSGDGIKEVKTISAMSLEWLLSSRRLILEQGTYRLYNPADIGVENPNTILGIVHTLAPEWSLNVDKSLWNVYRTFDETDEGVLDWLSGEAAKSFGCIFCFDTYNKQIHVIDANANYSVAPIYLSYENLIKDQDINVNTDDFFSVLSVYGADPVNIRDANPIGSNKIYNLEYFIENGDIDEPLASKWHDWLHEVDNYQETFTTLSLMRSASQMRIGLQEADIKEINNELAIVVNEIDANTDMLNIIPEYIIVPASDDDEGESGEDDPGAPPSPILNVTPSEQSGFVDYNGTLSGTSGRLDIQKKTGSSISNVMGYNSFSITSCQIKTIVETDTMQAVLEGIVSGNLTFASLRSDAPDPNARATCTGNMESGTLTVTQIKNGEKLVETLSLNNATINISGLEKNLSVGVRFPPNSDRVYDSFMFELGECTEALSCDGGIYTSSSGLDYNAPDFGGVGTKEVRNPEYEKIEKIIQEKNVEKAKLESQISNAEDELADEQENFDHFDSDRADIVNRLKLESYFTEDELRILSLYFLETDFEDETFAVFDVDVSESKSKYFSGTVGSISVACDIEDGIIKVDTSSIDPEGIINETMYLLTSGDINAVIEGDAGKSVINAAVLSGTYVVSNDVNKPQVICAVYAGAGALTTFDKLDDGTYSDTASSTIEFTNANITLTGLESSVNLTEEDSETLEGGTYIAHLDSSLGSCKLYTTRNSSSIQSYSVQQNLYRYAKEQHKKIAYPSCQFDISSGNLVFAQEFESFKNNLQLGSGVYLELSDSTVLTPLLLEIHLEFEDETNFNLVFSNDFQRHDRVENMKSIIEDAQRASRTLDMSKYNYGAFVSSGAQNEIRDMFNRLIDASANQIAAGSKQSVIIDGTGITVKNAEDQSAPYIRMNNGMVSMMDPNRSVAKLAFGRFYDYELGVVDGIVAPNIVGTMIAGEDLVIRSNKVYGGVQSFRIDGSGVSLANGQFDLYKTIGSDDNVSYSKTISLNPELGVLVGNLDKAIAYDDNGKSKGVYLYEDSSEISLSEYYVTTIDDAGDSIRNLAPNFWIDLNGSVFLRGTIYAVGGVIDMGKVSVINPGDVDATSVKGIINPNSARTENKYGGVSVIAHTDVISGKSRNGAILYAVNNPDEYPSSPSVSGSYPTTATNYFIATSKNVRMQAGDTSYIEITKRIEATGSTQAVSDSIVLAASTICLNGSSVKLLDGNTVASSQDIQTLNDKINEIEQRIDNLSGGNG